MAFYQMDSSAIVKRYVEERGSQWVQALCHPPALEDCRTQYHIAEIDEVIADIAIRLTQRHPLRAYDAVQLAAALLINQRLAAEGFPHLVFVSADGRLCTIGLAEGLLIENPSLHP